jgi:putative isomerase
MDDSPLYDDITYNAITYTMDLDDVGLNSLFALDAECLAKIAGILHHDEEGRTFAAEYARMGDLVRARLWNEQDGMFENRFWSGQFSKRLGPSNFYPMLAGIATAAQERRMVDEHLLNPREFWGDYVMPTIARNDPAFHDQYYWRGDIWPPTNYFVAKGLERYAEDRTALQFADKSYRLFMDDWKTNQHSDEQY